MNTKAKKTETKSIYSKDGKYLKGISAVMTVGEMKKLISKLPADLPIRVGMDNGVKPVWFNVGKPDEHMAFEENDETWD